MSVKCFCVPRIALGADHADHQCVDHPGENIRRLRLARGMRLEDLAEKIGTDTGNLSRLERGKQGYNSETLSGIARALSVSVAELFSRHLMLSEPSAAMYAYPVRRIPVVGTAQLGTDGYWQETEHPVGVGEGYVQYQSKDANAYALRVKGDSMRPRIKPGEFVIVEPNVPVSPGDEVVVTTKDGRAMIKVLHTRKDGLIELLSINEDHRPITIEEVQVERIHYVAGIAKVALYYNNESS